MWVCVVGTVFVCGYLCNRWWKRENYAVWVMISLTLTDLIYVSVHAAGGWWTLLRCSSVHTFLTFGFSVCDIKISALK